MKRVLALCLSASSLLALGCLGASSYDLRLEKTLENMKYQQKLDQSLSPAVQGQLKDLGVYVRPPKELAPVPAVLPAAPGAFDAVESFSGAQGGVPLQLHILARLKQPPKAQAKPGQAAPPPAASRANFTGDVQAVLNSHYAGAVPVGGKLDTVNERGRSYQKQKFPSPTGSTVDVYYLEDGNHQVALVWDIAPAAANSPAVEPGIRLTTGSMAVGRKAANLFSGGDEDTPAAGAGATRGVTF